MTDCYYRIREQFNDEALVTHDYKEAKRVAKRICRETGSAIIERVSEELGMIIDEEFLERNDNY